MALTDGPISSFPYTSSKSTTSESSSVSADPVWLSKEYLLKVIMEQCEVSNEDLRNPSLVKNKVRDSKIITVLSK